MDQVLEEIRTGRKAMRDAFVELITLALEAGADWELVSKQQHQFWSGNERVNLALKSVSPDPTTALSGPAGAHPAGTGKENRDG